MKTFILCGGMGSRLDSEGKVKPKPLVNIGNQPILLHIINIYHYYRITEFVLCMGYRGKMIYKFFIKKFSKKIISIEKKRGLKIINIKYKDSIIKIFFVQGKNNHGTGGRIKFAYEKLNLDEDILMTYGDGVGNINIRKLIKFHYSQKSLATLTTVLAPHRFGILNIKNNRLKSFDNKNDNNMINAGFFVLSKNSIKFIKNLDEYWESKPMQKIIKLNKMTVFHHKGFWKSLDTLKDKKELNQLWAQKKAIWKIWK